MLANTAIDLQVSNMMRNMAADDQMSTLTELFMIVLSSRDESLMKYVPTDFITVCLNAIQGLHDKKVSLNIHAFSLSSLYMKWATHCSYLVAVLRGYLVAHCY